MKSAFSFVLILLLLGCSKNQKKEEEIPYYKVEEESILQAKKNSTNPRLLLDFYVNDSKERFDSIINTSISENIIKKAKRFPSSSRIDSAYYLTIPSKININKNDTFFFNPTFRNDSLKAININRKEGVFHYRSFNKIYHDYKSLITKKYGEPILTDSLNNAKHTAENAAFWIKDGLLINLYEESFNRSLTRKPDSVRRTLYITYSSIEFEKDKIYSLRLKNELYKANHKKRKTEEELELKRKEREFDSLRNEVF